LSNNTNFNFYRGTRSTIDLYSKNNIEKYLNDNKIDTIIHCAIEGGKRLTNDTEKVLYNNILMTQNLLSCKIPGTFINIASGAEFDRRRDILNFKEHEIYNSYPIDYYGLSKNIISKLINNTDNGFNLRIFGCFNHNENPTRMIWSNLMNYINKNPMIIHQDKYMDFIYVKDLCKLILYIINNPIKNFKIKDINVVYKEKYKLSDITNIINTLEDYKVDINIENKDVGLSYTGCDNSLSSLNLNLKGLEIGIKEIYDSYKFNTLY
jgi:nucleoside-diphosphate-sugar epimerase